MAGAPVDRFIPGFVGVPGQRTFYLQVDREGSSYWYLMEKTQVAGLAVLAEELLDEAGFTGAGTDLEPGDLIEPDAVEFRVAEMALSYDETTGLIELTLAPTDADLAPVVLALTPAQLDAAARIGAAAVAGGRPPCPKCGLAMDPEGHVCPTTNGDLRHHRP